MTAKRFWRAVLFFARRLDLHGLRRFAYARIGAPLIEGPFEDVVSFHPGS